MAEFLNNGFTILEAIYSPAEVDQILNVIAQADTSNDTFRKSNDLFAIRQFFKEVPSVVEHVFNTKLQTLIRECFGENYFAVKSIYFDKPESSNWFVACHQDLTISVDKKVDLEGFGPWTVKQNQFGVQPPLEILQSNFTIRIHLDDTDENNGALKIVPGSHLKGIYRPEDIDLTKEKEVICNVKRGGVMIMKPMLLHRSGRTTNHKQRRVVHVEFSNQELPDGIQWAERLLV